MNAREYIRIRTVISRFALACAAALLLAGCDASKSALFATTAFDRGDAPSAGSQPGRATSHHNYTSVED
ncbi:hypothetical protein [Burkholderia gladioli]|uniref:hypothetical protein n=1 Tax=Burkholderia gladioli TaxID=28095 RepID=UPI000F7FE703|nr:hypothetical protein [Burkholderia gladioli]MDN7810203.1 hypothetical protein [Burkholderia gladioli]